MLVASYPRSGSNWIARTIEAVLLGRIGWTNPQARGRRGIYHDLDRFISTGRLGEIETWRASSSLVLKTHRTPDAIRRDAPGVLGDAALRVGILRSPIDVMASVFRFLLWSGSLIRGDETVRDIGRAVELGLVGPFVESFIESRGHPAFESMGFGSWSSHAASWSGVLGGADGVRLLYRDLKRDAPGGLSGVFDRLGLAVSREEIGRALAGASPERIGAQFGDGFVNTATDGSHADVVSPAQHERALSVFAEEIGRYGLGEGRGL